MSILKTKCPTLSDLAESIGPINGIDLRMAQKPLCDNIFDIQRSELVEVLERLRTAFWSDEITTAPPQTQAQPSTIPTEPQAPPQIAPQVPQHHSLKRPHSEPPEDDARSEVSAVSKKRVRLNTPQVEETPVKKLLNTTTTPTPPPPQSPKSLQSFTSLWPLKKNLIRQIKTAKYDEPLLLNLLSDIYQTKSQDQCRHLAIYLLPMARAMRRERIVKVLEKWMV